MPFLLGMASCTFHRHSASKYWTQRKCQIDVRITRWFCTLVLSSAGDVAKTLWSAWEDLHFLFLSTFAYFTCWNPAPSSQLKVAFRWLPKTFILPNEVCVSACMWSAISRKGIWSFEHQLLEYFSSTIPFPSSFTFPIFFLVPLSTSSFSSGPLVWL